MKSKFTGFEEVETAVNKFGDYSNIPCNIFDKRQYDLENVENDDEYNNLLLMNLNIKLSRNKR